MDKIRKHIAIVIAITLLGELYFYPISGDFRFCVGVVALNIVLLVIDDFNEIKLSISTGLSVLILRLFLEIITTTHNTMEILVANIPASIYYILYGFIAYAISLRKNRDNPLRVILSLFSIDVVCNIIEASIRQDLNLTLFKFILLFGLIRSIVAFGFYITVESQKNIIRKKEHQKRYIQLNTLVSNIQAELFYLKKSTNDIENVMNISYALYENSKDNDKINQDAINIATEVHEIKKDYYRVLNGFENFLKEFAKNESMSFKDIAFIIEGNSKRSIEESNKKIEFSITINDNIYISKYYSIFTILNNLITNSIDAIEENGYIKIIQDIIEENIIFTVMDNGKGIEDTMIPYIFNPGFTTKFNKNTGISSTGIGLSHVKNIIDELHGNITVNSNKKVTEFKISIPLHSLKIQ